MFQNRRSLAVAVAGWLATAVMVAVVVPVEAADEPENVIKYRRIVMQSHGTHLRPIAMIINGEVSFSGHIVAHARAAHDVSLMLADLFPKGTDVGDTRAKPEIWEKTAEFQAALEALKTATAELVRVAEAGDMAAIGAQLGEVGNACGGCHKPFRKEKQ